MVAINHFALATVETPFGGVMMVEVSRLGRPELLVEIEAIAYAGASRSAPGD